MARTISVFDDSTNVTASVTIGDSGVTNVQLTAVDGAIITSDDLRLLPMMGLPLPGNPAAAPAAIPSVSAAAKAVITGKAPVQRKPTSNRKPSRFDGERPDDATLVKMWTRHRGVKAHMAKQVGCHQSTMGMWVQEAQARGTQLPEVDA